MSTPARAIKFQGGRHASIARSPFSNSYISSSPIAQESIERDLAECFDDEGEAPESPPPGSEDESSDTSTVRPDATQHSMISSYRRPSFIAFGGVRPAITPQPVDAKYLTKQEKKQSRNEERSLLRDNHLAPPKHPEPQKLNAITRLYKKMFSPRRPKTEADEEAVPDVAIFGPEPTETTSLLGNGLHETTRMRHERLNAQWELAVASGKIKTTWQREVKTIVTYSTPLVVTFVLQYSLTVASIFTIGHLGKIELGAVSLASMTANITGFAVYQGLATSLDTLCAQAYGSGRKHLVGLQLQRMVYFLWLLTIPIAFIWVFAEQILEKIVPEKESARFAGLYLRVLIFGAPGYAAFESGKRFVQAQGMFSATTYVLLVAAPLNAFMNWLFVWHLKWGFIGAPIAVAITDNLLPIFLFLYVRFVDGRQCWNGFTWKAFHNWGPMIKLSIAGLVMLEAEFLAFEVLTLAASYFSTTHLAAQSVLSTITSLAFQIPFPVSIATSTRVANLIGATLVDAARTSAIAGIACSTIVGLFNVTLLYTLRDTIPQLFTNDQDVIGLVAAVMPVCAAFQLADAWSAMCNGLLRALGRQHIGGWVNLFCYYVIALPISFGTAFGLGWDLDGLWTGVAIALGLVAITEGVYLYNTDWDRAVDDAQDRNNAG